MSLRTQVEHEEQEAKAFCCVLRRCTLGLHMDDAMFTTRTRGARRRPFGLAAVHCGRLASCCRLGKRRLAWTVVEARAHRGKRARPPHAASFLEAPHRARRTRSAVCAEEGARIENWRESVSRSWAASHTRRQPDGGTPLGIGHTKDRARHGARILSGRMFGEGAGGGHRHNHVQW